MNVLNMIKIQAEKINKQTKQMIEVELASVQQKHESKRFKVNTAFSTKLVF